MIIKIKNNDIKKIILGNKIPEKGDLLVPDSWRFKDLINFIEDKNINKISSDPYKIDENFPDSPFYLIEV